MQLIHFIYNLEGRNLYHILKQGEIGLEEINDQLLQKENSILYIHTPFCGTCHLARAMLNKIEEVHGKHIFYEMNASLYPQFMQEAKIESVPCLLIKKDNVIKEKIYAFKSIANIYHYLMIYCPQMFIQED